MLGRIRPWRRVISTLTTTATTATPARRIGAGELIEPTACWARGAQMASISARGRNGVCRISEDEVVDFASTFERASGGRGIYLLIGHGASGLYQDPDSAVDEALAFLEEDLGLGSGSGKALIMFGGDPARDEAPDLGYLIREVRKKLDGVVEIMSVQYWPDHDEHLDYLCLFKQRAEDFKPDGRPYYGGTCPETGAPVAATRIYLGEAMMPRLSAVLCIGGGPISLAELKHTVKNGTRHFYVRAKSLKKRSENPYGPVDDWYASQFP